MKDLIWNIKIFEKLSTTELYAILKVRQEVFIVEQACYYLDADGYDEKGIHIWAENENEIVAYCRIFPPGVKYKESSIGRVLTRHSYRNLNLGKTLLTFALNIIDTKFLNQGVRISAQDYLLKFYQNFGFEADGMGYLEDNIPHTEMIRNIN